MSCDDCASKNFVVETRSRDGIISRARKCPTCRARWRTVEVSIPVHITTQGFIDAVKDTLTKLNDAVGSGENNERT